MYKRTFHDGSVSYSVMLPDPPAGKGKHYKRPEPIQDVLRRMHVACIGQPAGPSQLVQDIANRHLKKFMNKIKQGV